MPNVLIESHSFIARKLRVSRTEATRHFDETAKEMQSYAIKRDAFRRTLGNRDEEDAHLHTLIHFAGAKDISHVARKSRYLIPIYGHKTP